MHCFLFDIVDNAAVASDLTENRAAEKNYCGRAEEAPR